MKKKMDKEHVCFVHKTRKIRYEEISKLFGNIGLKRCKAVEFIKKEKTNKIIPIEELQQHQAALFQTHHYPEFEGCSFQEYRIDDVMIDFQVDKEKGEVKAQKLMKCFGEYELETRIYYIENYGKTWRAWDALPTREAAQRWD